MAPIYYFDIAALVLLFVLLITVFSRRMTRGRENIVFLLFLLVSMLATTCSLTTAIASNWPIGYPVGLRYVLHTCYLLFRNLIGPCYVFYIVTLTDTWDVFRKGILGRMMVIVPFIIIAILLLVVNPLTHLVFYIDDTLVYQRGKLFILLYVSAVFYLVYAMVYIILNYRMLERTKAVALFSLGPLTAISVVVQFVYPMLLVEMFCTMIANVLMLLAVHRPEEAMDAQTGLKNLPAYIEDIRRHALKHKSVGMIIISIANYDSYATLLGYERSNELLRRIAKYMLDISFQYRSVEVYHIGNGRFHFVTKGEGKIDLDQVANDINRYLRDGIQLDGYELSLIAYVSVVRCPEDVSDYPTLMRYSNELVKSCDYTGQVIYASKVIKDSMKLVVDNIDDILDDALINHRFEVYYQPIFSVKDQSFTSAEALLRLRDAEGRFISPAQFIPAAERSGKIHRIGDYVLEEVCRFISSEDFAKTGMEYIEINLSVSQCMHKELANRVLTLLEKYHVDAKCINLEITETAVGFSQNILMENLEVLSQAGVTFSLDDFGTGYSNMVRVASLPLRIVKLDKSFVDRMDNPRIKVIVRDLINLIKDVDMEIVVEGVETGNMANQFAEYDCEYIQGYYYAKPMPKQNLLQFLCE